MDPTARLPRSSPEAQGIASAAIAAFVAAADAEVDTLHSLVLLRHGCTIAAGGWAPYQPDAPHLLFSISKSFTSAAIGLLVAAGRLSVDDPVLPFFAADAPAQPGANLRAMRVRHLLSMATGHDTEPQLRAADAAARTWVQIFLDHPVPHAPGTHFLYNSAATYMLSALVQQITGGRLIDYLRPRLFDPLGVANPTWEVSPQGIDTGGWGLTITTTDIAVFGQLLLQRGAWEGRQLLPAAWVDAATRSQIANGPNPNPDWAQGYGYQFWRCRHNAYRGDGAFGQYCLVMPDQDAVLAITGGLDDMQQVLNLVWQHLLPAFGAAALPADGPAQTALADQLAALRLRPVAGARTAPLAAQRSDTTFSLDPNADGLTAIRFQFAGDAPSLTVQGPRGPQQINIGYAEWAPNPPALRPPPAAPLPAGYAQWGALAASGAWPDDHTFVVKLWWLGTPFAQTQHYRFTAGQIRIDQRMNVGFGPLEPITLTGHAR